MGRKPKDDNATKNLRPGDETQRAKEGTKIGRLPKDEVMTFFRRFAHPKKS